MAVESVALHIRDHQVALTDWEYADLGRELHRWVEIFDQEFKLRLPNYPVIRFSKLRNAYACYAPFRSTELGTRDNITFNTDELKPVRPRALILRTLLYELLHLHQQYHGHPPKRRYHNKEYRDKARECGLIVSPEGCTSGHTEAFTDLLSKYGVALAPAPTEVPLYGIDRRDQKLKKWSCACTNVRCATALDATCNRCGRPFTRAVPMRGR